MDQSINNCQNAEEANLDRRISSMLEEVLKEGSSGEESPTIKPAQNFTIDTKNKTYNIENNQNSYNISTENNSENENIASISRYHSGFLSDIIMNNQYPKNVILRNLLNSRIFFSINFIFIL